MRIFYENCETKHWRGHETWDRRVVWLLSPALLARPSQLAHCSPQHWKQSWLTGAFTDPGRGGGARREETLDTGHTIHSILSPVSIMTGMRLPHRYSTRQEDLVEIISEIKQHLKSIHAYQLAFLPFWKCERKQFFSLQFLTLKMSSQSSALWTQSVVSHCKMSRWIMLVWAPNIPHIPQCYCSDESCVYITP